MGLPVGLVGPVPAGTAAAPVGPTRPVAGSAGPAAPGPVATAGPVAAYTPYAGAAAAPGAAPWAPAASDAAAGAPSRAPWESAAAGTASVASDAAPDPASVAAGPATCLVSRVLPAGLPAGVVPAGTAGSADGESGVVVMGAVCQTRAAPIHALRPGAGPRPAQGPVAGKAGHATNDHRPRIHQGTSTLRPAPPPGSRAQGSAGGVQAIPARTGTRLPGLGTRIAQTSSQCSPPEEPVSR